MLPIIKVENERGEVLDFSASPRYLAMLSGTGSPAATINRTKVAVADGTRYNSATVGERNLLLTIYLRGDIARARMNLYRFFAAKSRVKIYYQADDLDVFIEGYVETAEVNPWEQNQNMQVSIICPMPFWQDVAESYTDASSVEALFEFPFSIEVTTGGDTVAWDGNTEGHFIADGNWVKVSDAVPTYDDLANGYRVTYENGVSYVLPQDGFSAGNGVLYDEDPLVVIITDHGSQYFGDPNPEPGVYLNMDEAVRKLTIYGYTGFPENSDYRDTLAWDGTTEGKITVENMVKVSDAVPTMADFENGYSIMFNDGRVSTYWSDDLIEGQDLLMCSDYMFTIAFSKNASPGGSEIYPEPGIYLATDENIKSLTIYGYTAFPATPAAPADVNTFAWDGNSDGKVFVDDYVKVSDVVPTSDDLAYGCIITFEGYHTEVYMRDDLTVGPGYAYCPGCEMIVISDAETPLFGLDWPETGIYTDYTTGPKTITIPGYTGDPIGVELSVVDPTASAIIENNGTVPAGVIFEITATVASHSLRIYNLSTGEFIGLDMELQAGDRVLINTTIGSKSVVHIRNGVRTNCINAVVPGSSWLQMAIGPNEYSYTVNGECALGIYHTNMYIGV